ncbi:type II toxin-antitoxin system MqsA family antitoxin [Clostridium estertheticum]|uniref:type II toxin-antitoxin system MqsA family antitoxin n=1 Tax=Clostridium estertheticum TaxID=238834 RepID=UPI001C7DB938|nr:type II toxin-antitoxin system MqsA family antitoxin [Clostridium estertheticum]MBX4267511.1 type II toxin-antitoxin system MqsA family antitoxin [Clostridium estertheticum]WLC91326.1 type II toxin-antitoxin system MqsA family antitoxin [Clostridium estertheticum]
MKCLYCGTELKQIKTIHKEYEEDLTIGIKNTPVDFCSNCQEDYLSAATMDKLNKILDSVLLYNKDHPKDDIVIVDYNDFN